MIGGMIYFSILGFQKGNPSLLASPFDQDGHQCGIAEGYENYSNIYISYLVKKPSEVGFVCVSKCPT